MKNPFPTSARISHPQKPKIFAIWKNHKFRILHKWIVHCAKFAQHYSTCAKFAPPNSLVWNSHHPTPLCEFLGFSPLPSPILSLWASFLCSLMAKTRGGSTSAPQRNHRAAHRAAPMRAPLDAPSHLPDSAPQSRYYTRRAAATPVAPTQIPARSPPTKKAKTSEPGDPPEQLEIHSLNLPPLDALSSPARPLRATPIAEREHSMMRHILITMFCDSSLSWGIHIAYLRGTILYPLWLHHSSFIPE